MREIAFSLVKSSSDDGRDAHDEGDRGDGGGGVGGGGGVPLLISNTVSVF